MKLVEEVYEEMVKADGTEYVQPDVAGSLAKVWILLEHPPPSIPWLDELMEKCREAQGRPLTVVDMEHLLCKIARYAGKS